jgi:hypothetical protein
VNVPVPPVAPLPNTIRRERVLAVEGRDAEVFFVALLHHLRRVDEIEVRNFGGLGYWPTYPRALAATPGFAAVTSLGIVRDAERSARSALQSIQTALAAAGLPVPSRHAVVAVGTPNVSAFILPDGNRPGMLESLCLSAVASDPATACLDPYFDCVKQQGVVPTRNPEKARLHAFLATRHKPDLLLGQAASAGYFPWDDPVFEPLKDFLRRL